MALYQIMISNKVHFRHSIITVNEACLLHSAKMEGYLFSYCLNSQKLLACCTTKKIMTRNVLFFSFYFQTVQ